MDAGTGIYGFGSEIGLVVERLQDGESLVTLAVEDHHRNFFGIVHGGVVLTLLDQSCGAALRSTRPEGGPQGSVTIDLQTVFVSAARGERLTGRGVCLRKGKSVAQCSATVEDADGQLVATAAGVFKLFE